jgi:hypothetical protein
MKALIKIKGLLTLALLWGASLGTFDAFAQCSQNNIIVTGYQLRNEFGEVFSVTDEYELGDPVTGELWVNFGGSTTNGYNLTMYYDVFINGVRTADDQVDCMYSGTQIVQNVWTKVRDFDWIWGDVVEIKDIFMYWETGTAKPNTTCNFTLKNNINAQCYSNPEGYTAAVPLFPKFDFDTNGICNTTIEFTSQTIGGSPPFNYTFSWDFDGLGSATGANPVFNFPATGTYTIGLTADDGVSVTTIYKDIFIDPNFGIQVSVLPTKLNDNSGTGIIYVQNVTGGTPEYSFAWTGPDGFMSNDRDIFGLKSGLYTLLVTDSRGCQQTEQYFLDVASVLKFEWKSFEVNSLGDRVQVIWDVHNEVAGSEYILERSLGNAENFVPISGIFDASHSDAPVRYELSDSTFPVFEKNIYYRLIKRFGALEFISPIKSVIRNNSSISSWMVYPNPSRGQKITLANPDVDLIKEESIRLELFDSGNYFRQIEINQVLEKNLDIQTLFGDLPKGVLYLRVVQGKEVSVLKLVNSN